MATTHNNSQTQLLNNADNTLELPQQPVQQDSLHNAGMLPSDVQNAYLQGRSDESRVQNRLSKQARSLSRSQSAQDNTASGMLIGLIVAFLAASAGAAAYLWGTYRGLPTATPQVERESTTERETTIIERAGEQIPERLPEVNVDVPDVNVTIPEIRVPEIQVPEINFPATGEADAGENSTTPMESVSEPADTPVLEGE